MTVRVLLVDDSAFVRKVLREVLARDRTLEVVGHARDGLEALEKIAELAPDVVTLDLMMPNLDGIGVLDALRGRPGPAVVVVSTSPADSELAILALERGAVEMVEKPTALASERLYELGDQLLLKIKIAASAKRHASVAFAALPAVKPAKHALLTIGTSTGGPQALTRLIAALPADFPLPVAVALHIPAGYTDSLARRLNETSALEVVEASPGIDLRAGRVVLARGGSHLKLKKLDGALLGVITQAPIDRPHHPSVDVLFESAAEVVGAGTLALVMTGMGNDGLAGSHALRKAGGMVLTEAESTCVVYGMPRVIDEAGLSSGSAPLHQLAALLVERA
ncbi:MAG TPA: chemotaxis-specific protein-glutamate methyltransferase CheB [Polyangiales bacterium]|nr:chemotaxis-specific protein-glutamate methyltransferase CheB [Polyangiales bacterium]